MEFGPAPRALSLIEKIGVIHSLKPSSSIYPSLSCAMLKWLLILEEPECERYRSSLAV